jgi:hypothetical protein
MVHVLPTGSEPRPAVAELDPRTSRVLRGIDGRIERARRACAAYLADLSEQANGRS